MRTPFLCAWLLGAHPALAATYYVAANGNDSYTATQAQNQATPWKSLAKLNSALSAFQPGDQVLFRRGDTFRGQLTITRSGTPGSPLLFGAYGATGAPLPVLSGSTTVSGWALVGTNLWEASVPGAGATVSEVVAHGRPLPLGRYPNLTAPNKGYLTISAHQGSTQLTSAQLTGSWVGGDAIVRTERWVLERLPITDQAGTTLTLTNTGGKDLEDKWGFFVQNHPNTLDQKGEWYYNPATHRLRLFSTTDPTPLQIEATVDATAGVQLGTKIHDITLENLTVANSLVHGIKGESITNLTVRGVTVVNSGQNGVMLNGRGGSGILIENSQLLLANVSSVGISGHSDVTLRNNLLRANGLVAGRGCSQALGVAGGSNFLIEGNTLDSCGYVGISYGSANHVIIRHNLVQHYDLVKDDGGGIYTWNNFSPPFENLDAHIVGNIVRHAVGAPEGTPDPDYVPAHGIYLDDCSRNVEVAGNTVSDCAAGGLFLHGNQNIKVTGNTLYNNGSQLEIAPSACGNNTLTIQNNILASTFFPRQRQDKGHLAAYSMAASALTPAQLGTLSANYYCQPFSEGRTIYAASRYWQLSDWQAALGQDANSLTSPVTFQPYRVDTRIGTNRLSNGDFTAGSTKWNLYTSNGQGQQSVDNTNRLGHANSLRLSFGSLTNNGAVLTTESSAGALQQAKRYMVRFRAACSAGTEILEVYCKGGGSTFGDLTVRTKVRITTTPRDYEVALVPLVDEPVANVAFTLVETARQVWLDDLVVQEATLTPAAVADSVRFEYNAAATPRTVSLPAGRTYVDARNVRYTGSVTLAPYTSVVLFAAGSVTQPLASHPAVVQPVAVYPNPTTGPFTVQLPRALAGEVSLRLIDGLGRVVRHQQQAVAAGTPHLNWTASGLPAGLYLLHVQQGPQVHTQKLLVQP